jgi:hypothetical protein
MDDQGKAAYVFAQSVACLCELEAMKAENASRADRGLAQAYGEDAFNSLSQRYCIGHNDVLNWLQNGGR